MRRGLAAFALVWLFAVEAEAQLAPYEWVTQAGRNNLIDSNAESCDHGAFDGTTWFASGQGCYNRTGRLCSADPTYTCDLQVVPKGRCTYGNPGPTGGPGGSNTCVWPHGAGRCASNTHVGCVAEAYLANPTSANAVTGPSSRCSSLATNTCDMTVDPYGGPFRQDCQCDGENPSAANFETAVCGGTISVCSDGDPDRDRGGYGWALGTDLNLIPGGGAAFFPALGPSVNGSTTPNTSPRYPLENPPSMPELQRAAGTINRPSAGPAGAIQPARTTEARTISDFLPALGVRIQRTHGDSFWSDWTFESKPNLEPVNTHRILLPCAAPVGWSVDQPLPDGRYCSAAARDGLTFLWGRDLTAAEIAANPTCPPSCRKDFDLTTVELEAIQAVTDADTNAGMQLAIQSGQGRWAGAGDAITVTPRTVAYWLVTGDMRCKLGGWGNPPGFVGRCTIGPAACVPNDAANGDSLCTGLGQGVCAACNGPIDVTNADITNGLPNALGLPPGYSSHGLPELDLLAQHRLGGIAGVTIVASVPLFLIETTGTATAEFRDTSVPSSVDRAALGEIDPNSSFGAGIGSGGMFQNGASLPIGASCCASGTDIVWGPEQPGVAVTPLLRTFDAGPGPDGIPGCLGDNSLAQNGASACDQRLGVGTAGAKTNPFFATGVDDLATTVPASRFGVVNASPSNLPTYNQEAAFAFRDASVLVSDDMDGLLKLNVSHCPILATGPSCGTPYIDEGNDPDQDGVPEQTDNCPTVANADQADFDGDGVGDACDNCVNAPNARVPGWTLDTGAATYLAANPWATVTGGQRDDDHDGFGNVCDADFPGTSQGGNVGPADTAQYRTAIGRSRMIDTCGRTGTLPCAIFDIDLNDTGVTTNIGPADTARFKLLIGHPAGPKCAACPLACEAGPNGSCF